jgi:hypothetical protein
MINVSRLSDTEFEVTVQAASTTTHRVTASTEDVQRLTGGDTLAETLLEKSFEFLLERESNTSILSTFDLLVIGRYFPEYEREMVAHFGG